MIFNSTFRNTPKPMRKSSKPMRARRLGKPQRENKHLADMCHGQQCYLLIPGVCRNDPSIVVPAHSNQLAHGKAKGMKADDQYTVPGCFYCHIEIDQGHRFTKEQKFAIWDSAYLRWVSVREKLLEQK